MLLYLLVPQCLIYSKFLGARTLSMCTYKAPRITGSESKQWLPDDTVMSVTNYKMLELSLKMRNSHTTFLFLHTDIFRYVALLTHFVTGNVINSGSSIYKH